MNLQFNSVEENAFFETVSIYLIEVLNSTILERGICTLVLSGGRTPLGIFEKLVENQDKLDWGKVEIYWLDERCVSHDSPESNFGMAKRHLINHLQNKPKYYPMYTSGDYYQAAVKYEELVRDSNHLPQDKDVPIFDVALIGIGSDGHVASIFPGGHILAEQDKLIMHEYIAKLDSDRISMTLPLINQFRHGIGVSRGEDKAWVVEACKSQNDLSLPISRVNLRNGTLTWFIC